MDVSIITKVPEDIFLDVVFTYLELKAMSFLDSAFCNSKIRNYVLAQYKSPFVSVYNKTELQEMKIMNYVSIRGLKLRELRGYTYLFSELFLLCNFIDKSQVTSIWEHPLRSNTNEILELKL